ncbi:hypothetical protein LJ655_26080 [Paraburkholderia sp. MMS20-SJTN17]|uniref:Uncharacterized protein n=1 Tax=Paraburkholderia translucens TaxID=2886945 RepID=A0ABS8KKN5_9BURK|nr:hypothetical protein [Paraburkholderia sp. MMS20-SJTN17]MCC8405290.1 hypothetical protein [Paraburkholderia sp. MMS20-SJTN17]
MIPKLAIGAIFAAGAATTIPQLNHIAHNIVRAQGASLAESVAMMRDPAGYQMGITARLQDGANGSMYMTNEVAASLGGSTTALTAADANPDASMAKFNSLAADRN